MPSWPQTHTRALGLSRPGLQVCVDTRGSHIKPYVALKAMHYLEPHPMLLVLSASFSLLKVQGYALKPQTVTLLCVIELATVFF